MTEITDLKLENNWQKEKDPGPEISGTGTVRIHGSGFIPKCHGSIALYV
jgi:hypothetical protein